jgi:soluble lytic murein transglycosylase-like protein
MEYGGRIGQRLHAPVEARRDGGTRARPSSGFEERLNAMRALDDNTLRDVFTQQRTLFRAIKSGVTDPARLTDLIFYMRHPHLSGVPLTGQHSEALAEWNDISADLVQPMLDDALNFLGADDDGAPSASARREPLLPPARAAAGRIPGGDVHKYDEMIERAVEFGPGLPTTLLKGLLAQESRFNPTVINQYGYAGIAQFGREAAREVGLRVGVPGSTSDERLNPAKAIPAAARLLNLKAVRLTEMAFSRFGQPRGVEFWKFVLAAYNGGEGTVTLAMGRAYQTALSSAKARGLVGREATDFACSYATKWENLKAGGANSPLGFAAARYFPSLAEQKFREIGDYPTSIVARARA